MMLASTPSLGVLIGIPIAALILAAAIFVAFISRGTDDVYGDARLTFWGAIAVIALTVVITGIAMWPWQSDYHFWKPINGRVEKISSRFVSAGDKGGTNQRFVVVVNGQPYGVDDTRASLLKVGDIVHLKCKREFVWGSGSNGWGCNWNGGP
jgi:hypothetical protein